MDSENDLPHQPETHLQQTPLNKKKGNSPWKVIFIVLFAIDIIYVFWAASLTYGCNGVGCIGIIGLLFFSLPLAIIDIIALLSYDFICRPRGEARVIWFTALILLSLPLMCVFAFFVALFVLGSIRVPGSYVSKRSSRAPNNTLPRCLML
jgi:hypothetical protein